ncbi:hypothetical protein ACS0TY_013651 [Phlomoides rotata]
MTAATVEKPVSAANGDSGHRLRCNLGSSSLHSHLCTCLVAVARCAWIRRLSGATAESAGPLPRRSTVSKGLKKKVLKSLLKLTYDEDGEHAEKLSDCAICLSEFTAGEEIRVLPQCKLSRDLLDVK